MDLLRLLAFGDLDEIDIARRGADLHHLSVRGLRDPQIFPAQHREPIARLKDDHASR